jgi:hypothetical protein
MCPVNWKQNGEYEDLPNNIAEEERRRAIQFAPDHGSRNRRLQHRVRHP